MRVQKYLDIIGTLTLNEYVFLLVPSGRDLLARLFNGKLSVRLRRSKKMTVLPFCVDLNHFPSTPPYSDRVVPNLFYGGSTNVKKHIPEIVNIATTLVESALIERFVVSTFENTEKFPQASWCKVSGNVMPEDYRALQRQGDIFVCLSDYDTSCLAPFEQLLSGQVGVFADRPWIREQIPKSYPYIVKDEDVLKLAAWVCTNLDEAREAVWSALQEMRERYGHASVSAHFIEVVNGWRS